MTDSLLSDKVVLVTGSTTGIGEAIARRCVAEGARVMVHGRDEARARRVTDDLGDAGAADAVVEAVVSGFGRIDALVNNAALTTRSNLETSDAAMFERVMHVNLRAPLLLTRAAVPEMRRQGGGVVLNIGSVNALCGEPNLLVYSMSKGGLQTMTRNLASTLAADQIRVNQLNVGWTLTDNERELKQEEGLPDQWWTDLPEAWAPYGRIFMPDEIAAHAVFWLSDAAGPVNGTVYEIEHFPMVGRNPAKE